MSVPLIQMYRIRSDSEKKAINGQPRAKYQA
jgi:hypothetical protein